MGYSRRSRFRGMLQDVKWASYWKSTELTTHCVRSAYETTYDSICRTHANVRFHATNYGIDVIRYDNSDNSEGKQSHSTGRNEVDTERLSTLQHICDRVHLSHLIESRVCDENDEDDTKLRQTTQNRIEICFRKRFKNESAKRCCVTCLRSCVTIVTIVLL